ncbi:hypothetical protein DPR02_26770 [Burkholderia cepacia]|uniref:Uncharacterized protein n=1 Tax=Burkholderia cepacia TaxID=292 RepID=A0AAQ0F9X9_BURCE|nr:hypothetical protein [Burkholderia cepacia]RAQ04258.1 hypothetical protein DPR02_26770 [Burkholderia cepacia]
MTGFISAVLLSASLVLDRRTARIPAGTAAFDLQLLSELRPMSAGESIHAYPGEESTFNCACCGGETRRITGELHQDDSVVGVYFVQWATGRPDHPPIIDLVLGDWGESAGPADRVLVSLIYIPREGGGPVSIVNAAERRVDISDLFEFALAREQVIGTPLAPLVFQMIDALWITDPRIADVKALDNVV